MEAGIGFRGVENGRKEWWVGLGWPENEEIGGERNSGRSDFAGPIWERPAVELAVVSSSSLAGVCTVHMAGKTKNGGSPGGRRMRERENGERRERVILIFEIKLKLKIKLIIIIIIKLINY